MSTIQLLAFNGVEPEFVQALIEPLGATFHSHVTVSESSLDLSPHFDKSRSQFNSTSILQFIKKSFVDNNHQSRKNPHATRAYLAVTGSDLFIPILTYVFGEAELHGHVGVVSYYRLQTERYGLLPNSVLLSERLIKEATHELGHVFGLVHCMSSECVMHTSTYAEDIDLKSAAFCRDCGRILRKSTGV